MERSGTEADAWWRWSAQETFQRLDATEAGLTTQEARRRLLAHGTNEIAERGRRRWLRGLLQRLRNPLVLVLLAAAAVSAVVGDPASFLIITAIVLMSIVIDIVQEHRADEAAEKLRERVALRVAAQRDGERRDLPARDLVPGDVVFLAAGDLAPADCRLLVSRDLFVNEALMTGEPYPAEKHARDGAALDADTEAALFMGSSIVSGSAAALVVATGKGTRIGGIASSLQREPPPTAFSLGIRDFGLMIVRLTMLLVLFVLLVNLLFERPLLESFLFALALAVGLTPELLPMVVSVTLAHGAVRMARDEVIVKRLPSVHDLGSMDVLCSDKTGTLTEAKIRIAREVDIEGRGSRGVLDWAIVNAAFETGLKSPLDEAILENAPSPPPGWRKIDEVPFDFERRRVSVLAEKNGRRYLVVKGAPEDVLRLSGSYETSARGEPRPLDQAARARAASTFEELGAEGLRVLGVAWREVEPDRDHAGIADETELVFAGFAAFMDPPKAGAGEAIAELLRLGVAVKIVTGDNERVTRHVCAELGVEVAGVLTGPEVESLPDEALAVRLADVNLFCRVNPAQKARIIRALRRRGHVVGYLGDGINDAPSLHGADVGISLQGAVDVAKEAASMILLRNDLGVLARGVREGRRTYANIMKYVMMGTSSNFGNMFSMAGAVLFLPFLPMLPVQILLNNLLYDVSEIAIPLDNVEEEAIDEPHHWDIGYVREFMLVFGPLSSLFDYLAFALLLLVFQAGAALFQTGWFIASLATQVLVIFVIRNRGSPFASPPHFALAVAAVAVVASAVALPFTPLGAWFGFVAPPPMLLAAIAALTAAYLCIVEATKRVFHARRRPSGGVTPS